jgi:hypothetical protein
MVSLSLWMVACSDTENKQDSAAQGKRWGPDIRMCITGGVTICTTGDGHIRSNLLPAIRVRVQSTMVMLTPARGIFSCDRV